jgi:hypothetical protein
MHALNDDAVLQIKTLTIRGSRPSPTLLSDLEHLTAFAALTMSASTEQATALCGPWTGFCHASESNESWKDWVMAAEHKLPRLQSLVSHQRHLESSCCGRATAPVGEATT